MQMDVVLRVNETCIEDLLRQNPTAHGFHVHEGGECMILFLHQLGQFVFPQLVSFFIKKKKKNNLKLFRLPTLTSRGSQHMLFFIKKKNSNCKCHFHMHANLKVILNNLILHMLCDVMFNFILLDSDSQFASSQV